MNRAQRRKMAKQARGESGASQRQGLVRRFRDSVAAGARDNVIEIVSQGRVAARALEIAMSAFFLADHLVGRFEAEHQLSQPIACQAGCDACCYNLVELTPPEALLIGHHMAQHFSEEEKDAVLANAARTLALTAGKSKAEIAVMRWHLPCPLLLDRRCSVYGIRPLVCRAMHGLDATRCAADLESGSLTASSYYAHRQDLALSVSAGLLSGCQAIACQSATLNLAQALHDFFSQTNPVERWLNGEEVFRPSRAEPGSPVT
jgi:hypothetical protein